MIAFALRRLGLMVVALGVASVFIFFLLNLLPGDLAVVIAGTQASPEQVERIRESLGLNRPLTTQYVDWMSGVVRGDLGQSAVTKSSVAGQLIEKMSVTGPLVLMSTVISLIIAIPVGIFAAARSRRLDGLLVSGASQVGVAVPSFLIGIILIALLSGKFGLPAQGFPRQGWSRDFWRSLRSLILPALTLAFAQSAVLVRFVRASTLEVLNQDYIRTARSKGLTRTRALFAHGLRNASIPIVAVIGVQVASLIAGLVVIESLFNLPGVGQMLIRDIGQRDFAKVQGTVLALAAIVIIVGFLVDVAHHLIDPRLRTTGR